MTHRIVLLALVACGSSQGGSGAARTALQPTDIAITNVSVVPMAREGVLARHTVVVRGDRIVAVAPSAAGTRRPTRSAPTPPRSP